MAVRLLGRWQTLSRFYPASTSQSPGRTRGGRNPRFCLRVRYGKSVDAPKLCDFITDVYLAWAKVNKRTWVQDELRTRPLIEAIGSKTMDEISAILIEKYKSARRASKTVRGTGACSVHNQPRAGITLKDLLVSNRSGISISKSLPKGQTLPRRQRA
jgi:hypothetical protein